MTPKNRIFSTNSDTWFSSRFR